MKNVGWIKYPLFVTLDTNIFVSNKFDFGADSTLGLLANYVKTGKVKVVLSNIVVSEVERHIVDEGNKICHLFRDLRKEVISTASEEYIKRIGLDSMIRILDKKLLQEKSVEEWSRYLKLLRPEIMDNSTIDLNKVIEDYFAINPPFQEGEKKRKEFPDAFIASQIKARFGESKTVAIVSDDNGMRAACGKNINYLFFASLGELFDAISRQDEEYQNIKNEINAVMKRYISEIEENLYDEDWYEVHGVSYDRDGIAEGYDYEETRMNTIKETSCRVHTIDEITDDKIWATLLCEAQVEVECVYKDYDNAPWDSETQSYFYVDKYLIVERHKARFGIRVVFDREKEEICIIPFKAILNGDTLIERFEIDEDDNEMDLINQDRENLCFVSLDKYDDYLEDNLEVSQFKDSIMKIFEEINELFRSFEDVDIVYDEAVEQVRNNGKIERLRVLCNALKENDTFPYPEDYENISDEEIDEIIRWMEEAFERNCTFYETPKLPDTINYGDEIDIGFNGTEYQLVLERLMGSLSAGDEEYIDIYITNKDGEKIARGYVKLTVGYLEFDEDGGASDGLADDIEYSCDQILEFILKIKNDVEYVLQQEKNTASTVEEIILNQ